MNSNLVEVVEKQSSVISIQAGVIRDLFNLLSQYMTAEELDALPEVDRINTAAQIAAGF